MYGTIARLQVTPGMMATLQNWGSDRDASEIPGYVSQYVLQMSADSDELYLVVLYADKASYEANVNDPFQEARYREMRTMLAADPEWHDGEVIYSHLSTALGRRGSISGLHL